MFIPAVPTPYEGGIRRFPQVWHDTVNPDGTRAPWATAPAGSLYVRVDGAMTRIFQKIAESQAGDDWVYVNQTGVFDVRQFGAVGDDTTDDTSAIQAALDAASITGGQVFFPPGRYLTDTLRLYPHASNTFQTAGRIRLSGALSPTYATARDTVGTQLRHKDGSAAPLIDIAAAVVITPLAKSVFIENMLLIGGDETTDVIKAHQLRDNWRFDNLYIRVVADQTNGLYLENCYSGMWTQGRIFGTATGASSSKTGTGIVIKASADASDIQTNMMIFQQVDIYKMPYGIRLGEDYGASDQGAFVGPITFINGQVSHSDGWGIHIGSKGNQVRFLGTQLEYCYRTGVQINGAAHGVHLADMFFFNCGTNTTDYAVHWDNTGGGMYNAIVENCEFFQQNRGVKLTLAPGPNVVTMRNNMFRSSSASGTPPVDSVGILVTGSGGTTTAAEIARTNRFGFGGVNGYETEISGDGLIDRVPANNSVTNATYTNTGDTTPSVKNMTVVRFSHGSACTITAFDDGYNGQILYVQFNNTNTTIQHNATIVLLAGANYTPASADVVLVFCRSNGKWVQV